MGEMILQATRSTAHATAAAMGEKYKREYQASIDEKGLHSDALRDREERRRLNGCVEVGEVESDKHAAASARASIVERALQADALHDREERRRHAGCVE